MAGITHIAELKEPALRGIVEEVDKAKLETQEAVLNYLPDEYTYDQEFAYDVISKTSQIGAMIGIGSCCCHVGILYSHSMVEGGLGEMSKTTRLIPGTVAMMRCEIRLRSPGSR